MPEVLIHTQDNSTFEVGFLGCRSWDGAGYHKASTIQPHLPTRRPGCQNRAGATARGLEVQVAHGSLPHLPTQGVELFLVLVLVTILFMTNLIIIFSLLLT